MTDYQVEALVGKANYRRAQIDLGTTAVPLNECAVVHAKGGLVDRTRKYMEGHHWQEIVGWVGERLG